MAEHVHDEPDRFGNACAHHDRQQIRSSQLANSDVTVFEIYRDRETYLAHLQAPHFLKYKATIEKMVKSLKVDSDGTCHAWRQGEVMSVSGYVPLLSVGSATLQRRG
jgi:hypothetical protein